LVRQSGEPPSSAAIATSVTPRRLVALVGCFLRQASVAAQPTCAATVSDLGTDVRRPQLEAMVGFVREGDTVVVHSMNRLAIVERALALGCSDATSW
jgi:hypothetical protein